MSNSKQIQDAAQAVSIIVDAARRIVAAEEAFLKANGERPARSGKSRQRKRPAEAAAG